MKFLENRRKYLEKKITKQEFIKKNYNEIYNSLFEFSDLIKKTDIKKIEIAESEVSAISKKFGVKIFFPRYDYRTPPLECLNFGNYEEKEIQTILQIMPKKGNFLDIGANIGWHSLIVAKFNKKLKVYSFEPIKKNYNFLLKNIKCNFLKNIKPYNFGFYNKTKQMLFYTYQEGGGNSSLRNLSKKRNVILSKSDVKILDDFIRDKKTKVDFIKCDVEGAELFVFLGAKKILLNNKPIVLCEMLRKWSKKFKYHPNQLIQLFKSFGYVCFRISYLNNKKIAKKNWGGGKDAVGAKIHLLLKKIKLKEIKKITYKEKETNFLFIHKVKHLKIIKKFK